MAAVLDHPTSGADERARASRKRARVLRPNGSLLVSFHVEEQISDGGLSTTAKLERQPVADAEYPSRRSYALAQHMDGSRWSHLNDRWDVGMFGP